MRLYSLLGSKTNQAQMVKNAAHWTSKDEARRLAPQLQLNKLRAFEQNVLQVLDTETRIESAVRNFHCLNDIFAELIDDNQAMGLTA